MRIATWNVNGLRARLDFVRAWLIAREPDVVGLQELKVEDEGFPHELFTELGYEVITHGQKSWNGVAIASRLEVELEDRGLPGQEDFGARLISARVADLNFTTVYCPNGKDIDHADYARKLEWYDALIDYWSVQHPADQSAVLCGDFNIVPTALDSWQGDKADGRVFHTTAERERLARLLDCGLYDLYRYQYPDEQTFSWWDYRGGSFHRGHGLRIDFVLGSAPLRERLIATQVDRDFRKKKDGLTASDHAPVIVDLE